MSEILDSGNRRKFESGAVRDIQEGKGRMDLVPIREVAELFSNVEDGRYSLRAVQNCRVPNHGEIEIQLEDSLRAVQNCRVPNPTAFTY